MRQRPVQLVGRGRRHPHAVLEDVGGLGIALKRADLPTKITLILEGIQFVALILPQRHQRIDEQSRGLWVSLQPLEHRRKKGPGFAAGSGRGHDDVLARVHQPIGVGLMAVHVGKAEAPAHGLCPAQIGGFHGLGGHGLVFVQQRHAPAQNLAQKPLQAGVACGFCGKRFRPKLIEQGAGRQHRCSVGREVSRAQRRGLRWRR